jgi:hypothetical protein
MDMGAVPFRVRVLKLVDLAASSYDINGDSVRFEFEVVPVNQAFTEQNLIKTAVVKPDGISTLQVRGVISIPAAQPVRWRVRAVDEKGNSSMWTEAVAPQLLPMGILTPSPLLGST